MAINYSKKLPEDLDCGITIFMKVLGAKWKPCILDAINRGYQRPTEIHKQLSTATPRVIDMQLRELEATGLVTKEVTVGYPLRVDYSLTTIGYSIMPLIGMMDKWGVENKALLRFEEMEFA
ncbi:winged helix-turn-helix transcriptional regulator [Pedobacter sp. UBA5917]|jgi:DNA-binding HxlR family transcriptional regulator|uniref:winged helix-turn-helix transcriptional regulator n=1 Tax=Pedobacter sp. UBA5917 TaxID=1947061 RepID=UPI0025ED7D1C|nr:helix-turn-helix domain-containing protein [Pedobacter sp. UBA5917]